MDKLYIWKCLWSHEFIIDLSAEVCVAQHILSEDEPISIWVPTPNITNTEIPMNITHREIFFRILKDFEEYRITTPSNNNKLVNELFDFCLRYIPTDRVLPIITWALFMICDEFKNVCEIDDEHVITSKNIVLTALKNRLTDEEKTNYIKNIEETISSVKRFSR